MLYALHGLALVGRCRAYAVDSPDAVPYNIQRTIAVPYFRPQDLETLLHSYEQERGQSIDPAVITALFHETSGHPGLTGWLCDEVTRHAEAEPTGSMTLEAFQIIVHKAAGGDFQNAMLIYITDKLARPTYQMAILNLLSLPIRRFFPDERSELMELYWDGVAAMKTQGGSQYLTVASPGNFHAGLRFSAISI